MKSVAGIEIVIGEDNLCKVSIHIAPESKRSHVALLVLELECIKAELLEAEAQRRTLSEVVSDAPQC